MEVKKTKKKSKVHAKRTNVKDKLRSMIILPGFLLKDLHSILSTSEGDGASTMFSADGWDETIQVVTSPQQYKQWG